MKKESKSKQPEYSGLNFPNHGGSMRVPLLFVHGNEGCRDVQIVGDCPRDRNEC